MKTVIGDLRTLEPETGLSTGALRKVVLMPAYGLKLNGYAGHKLFTRLIVVDLWLQRALSASPMYSTLAARELVLQRVQKMKQVVGEARLAESVHELADVHSLSPVIYANLLARTQLVLLAGLALPSYMLSPSEIATYEDNSTIAFYEQALRNFAMELGDDMEALCRMYSELPSRIAVKQSLESVWAPAESNVNEIKEWRVSSVFHDTNAATIESVRRKIHRVHYSNVPYLVLDILQARGHHGRVIDGPNDGSRDLDTQYGGERYLTQVKTWKHPPVGAEMVRQHAQTCRTYRAKGIYVTTHRFAKNAELGQYPLQDNGADERQKIAEMELIDLDQLGLLTLQLKIGITGSERFEEHYWANMQMPRSRKLSEVTP